VSAATLIERNARRRGCDAPLSITSARVAITIDCPAEILSCAPSIRVIGESVRVQCRISLLLYSTAHYNVVTGTLPFAG
jgi:hypothetical protein